MWSSDSDREDAGAAAGSPSTTTTATSSCPSSPFDAPPPPHPRRRRHRLRRRALRRAQTDIAIGTAEQEEPAEAEDVWRGLQQQQLQRGAAWPRRASRPVVVAGDEEASQGSLSRAGSLEGSGGVGRARSLTDDDLEELKGCVDLGFGFNYSEIPELCGTLPALELCYSMSRRFLDEHEKQQGGAAEEAVAAVTAPASPAQPGATNWKISSPGDSPDEVKARLKYWAQAVACTVKLCS